MDIYLYDNQKLNFIKFPVVPLDLEISSPQEIESFNSVGLGELKLIGEKGARSFDLETFFPNSDYPFLKDRTYKGMEYVEIIESWRDSKLPLTIIISHLNINFECAIEDFTYSVQDGSGDIYYNLSIIESSIPKIVKKQNKNIVTNPDAYKSTGAKKAVDNSSLKEVEYLKNSYGIVTAKTNLNVRSGAGTNYKIIGKLKSSEKIKIYRLSEDKKWWQIKYGNSYGYVSASYVRRV